MQPGILQAQGNSIIDIRIPCEKLTALKVPDVIIAEAAAVSTGSCHCYDMSGLLFLSGICCFSFSCSAELLLIQQDSLK
jgi:hypothetical protein